MMKKQIFLALLALCLVLVLVPETASAAYVDYAVTGGSLNFNTETVSSISGLQGVDKC